MSDTRERPRELRGILLRTGDADLLLPNEVVAEVVGFKEPTPYPGAPNWLLGAVTWRGCSVPLVSMALANEDPVDLGHGQRGRMVICYMPSGNRAMPYVAIFAVGPPRLARLNTESLVPTHTPPKNPFVLYGLVYGDRPAWIPDFDAMEQVLIEATSKHQG